MFPAGTNMELPGMDIDRLKSFENTQEVCPRLATLLQCQPDEESDMLVHYLE